MNILRLFTALFAVLLLSNFPGNAQLSFVPEWKLFGKGSFVAIIATTIWQPPTQSTHVF